MKIVLHNFFTLPEICVHVCFLNFILLFTTMKEGSRGYPLEKHCHNKHSLILFSKLAFDSCQVIELLYSFFEACCTFNKVLNMLLFFSGC